jgi:hypothetical protein
MEPGKLIAPAIGFLLIDVSLQNIGWKAVNLDYDQPFRRPSRDIAEERGR